MNERIQQALRDVTVRLRAEGLAFALGGSGLLWALGLTDEVADLDLMFEGHDEEAFLAATADWRVAHTRAGTDLWASAWHGRLEVRGVEVDAIGAMAFRHPGGVAAVPLRSTGTVGVADVTVPYADPALWWAVYRAYKPEKARLLERVVGPEQRAAVSAELGLEWRSA